jgi:hypothetical protein
VQETENRCAFLFAQYTLVLPQWDNSGTARAPLTLPSLVNTGMTAAMLASQGDSSPNYIMRSWTQTHEEILSGNWRVMADSFNPALILPDLAKPASGDESTHTKSQVCQSQVHGLVDPSRLVGFRAQPGIGVAPIIGLRGHGFAIGRTQLSPS